MKLYQGKKSYYKEAPANKVKGQYGIKASYHKKSYIVKATKLENLSNLVCYDKQLHGSMK